MAKRLETALKAHLFDPEGASLCRRVKKYFGWEVREARVVNILTLDTGLSGEEYESVRTEIFTNPVTQVSGYRSISSDFDWAVWVGYRPGVRDTAGSVAIEAIGDFLGRPPAPEDAAYTSRLYLLKTAAELSRYQVETIARELLANEIIQQWHVYSRAEWDEDQGIGIVIPKVLLARTPSVAQVPIQSDEQLAALSDERNLALNRNDIPVIRKYFLRPEVVLERAKVGLSVPTDVELEAISQARSDHCNHNTFRGKFRYRDMLTGETREVNNLFKTCIEAPTLKLKQEKDWVVSVLWDNAGVARFDEDYAYSVTGETHNSPSNMEAYGGSLTGIVGIYRDIMGTGKGSRLVAGLYGFCVGPRDYRGPLRPHLHPRRLLDGIIEGVKDGGNKHGVPTPFGNLFFHPCYLGKCLVFVASLGIMPAKIKGKPVEQKEPGDGDYIIMSGGRVGKDGIHGVTASSESYSESTPAGHVQIGDPYTQKKMHDFLLEARDEDLITFITDNGGGGLSSSVGESALMAGGAVVDVDKVPLKYEGLDVWEIWISESQERMTIAVAPDCLDRFMELSRKHEVESTVIGRYENTGKLHLRYGGKTCAYLDLSFFSEDFPQWEFDAEWLPPQARGLSDPVLSEPLEYGPVLHALLAAPNQCSREWIQRQYDHEVQGGSAVKLLVGRDRDVPNDAAVIRPVLGRNTGLAVSQALNPTVSEIDAYHMVAVTIDEAVRRIIAVGGKLDEIGGVDNFCWPNIQFDPAQNPDGRFKAAQLVRANWALRDMCLKYGIPLLSGKDSMYVDGHLPGAFGERHKVSGLPTMQFTATGIVPDVLKAQTMEVKEAGDLVYVLGVTRNELGASAYFDLFGYTGLTAPVVDPEEFLPLYAAVEKAIDEGLVASCHGIYRGGLAVHAAMSAFGGRLGISLDLARIPVEKGMRDDHVLFSESCGRFLVTIPRKNRGRFESLFKDLAPALAGEVTEAPEFVILGQSGKEIVREDIRSLRTSWVGNLG
ncbi:MAG: phosphoribosylformylglycinamidine synthase [Desulfobacteraceae bacterium]|nr:phosphoribosylformylglycinamidine synthase [Desulfobacteraceae bacterium]